MKSATLSRARWTRSAGRASTRAVWMAADDVGFIDLRPDHPGVDDPQGAPFRRRPALEAERMGLATAAGPGQ
jgi:hypothetical protein